MIIKIGPVHRGMTPGAETRALRQAPGMHLLADHWKIHLRMTTQAQIVVAGHEHLRMHGSVNLMAGGAAFAKGLMFKNKRAALFFVTVKASFINAVQRCR